MNQAIHYNILKGFLPKFAAQQMVRLSFEWILRLVTISLFKDLAQAYPGLLNVLGLPNTSTFATFSYCASSHTDKDDCITSGWVMDRPENVELFISSELTYRVY